VSAKKLHPKRHFLGRSQSTPHAELLAAEQSQNKTTAALWKRLEPLSANDLWGIHDLLLAGYATPFMKAGSNGQNDIRKNVVEFMHMLPEIHPHAECREKIKAALNDKPSKSGLNAEASLIVAAADASWDCLPTKFTRQSFNDTIATADILNNASNAYDARFPALTADAENSLSTCKGSLWPRTCSFWVSLHAMALRADLHGKGPQFLKSTLSLLAGGATMCGGCTMHFRMLNKEALDKSIFDDAGDIF
jgi:hypothetical protein